MQNIGLPVLPNTMPPYNPNGPRHGPQSLSRATENVMGMEMDEEAQMGWVRAQGWGRSRASSGGISQLLSGMSSARDQSAREMGGRLSEVGVPTLFRG